MRCKTGAQGIPYHIVCPERHRHVTRPSRHALQLRTGDLGYRDGLSAVHRLMRCLELSFWKSMHQFELQIGTAPGQRFLSSGHHSFLAANSSSHFIPEQSLLLSEQLFLMEYQAMLSAHCPFVELLSILRHYRYCSYAFITGPGTG